MTSSLSSASVLPRSFCGPAFAAVKVTVSFVPFFAVGRSFATVSSAYHESKWQLLQGLDSRPLAVRSSPG